MRIPVIVAIAAVAALVGLARPASAATAAEILDWCSSSEQERVCTGYLWAILDGSANPEMAKDKAKRACPPDDVDIGKVRTVVVERLSRMSGLETVTGGVAISPIVVELFPCK